MEIIQLARELGVALQQQECYKKFDAARKANDNDKNLQEMIGQFNLVRMSMDQALSAEERDNEKIKQLNEELSRLYTEVMDNPLMQAYNAAKTDLDALMQKITTVLSAAASGEDPLTVDLNGCTGSCETCSGCH